MRAVELIGSVVYDVDGAAVGTVRDLHFEAGAGGPADAGTPTYRLTALECGGIGLAHRLGYTHGEIVGPWPLTALFRALVRRSVMVDWADVTRLDLRRVEIGRRAAELRRTYEEEA